jgi:hypothetical protein
MTDMTPSARMMFTQVLEEKNYSDPEELVHKGH